MVLLIDNYDSFTYNLYSILAQQLSTIVKRNDDADLHQAAECSQAIVISPGPGRPEAAGKVLDIIQAYGPQKPILGICLGHQAICQAFGAAICITDPIHGKPESIHHTGQSIFNGLDGPFQAARYHSLIVDSCSLPDTLNITAKTETGLIMGISHKDYPIHGVQFHPESIITDQGPELIANFLGGINHA